MCGLYCCLLLFILVVDTSGQSFLINAYTKWVTNASKPKEEGRNNNGQLLFTHSSNVKLRSGQNLNKKNNVVYRSSLAASTKASGFQDRFNPPPAFQFGDSKRNVPAGQEYADHNHDHGPVYKPSTGSYDSLISSYNPVASGIPNADKEITYGPEYPPFAPAPGSTQTFKGFSGIIDGGGSNLNDSGYTYKPSQVAVLPTPLPTPPKDVQKMNIKSNSDFDSNTYPFPSYLYEDPPNAYSDSVNNHEHHYKHGHHQEHPQAPLDYSDFDVSTNRPLAAQKPSMADIPEYLDDGPSLDGKFAQFPLWSNPHEDYYDHRNYHPLTTTTTTALPPPEPEEEKRVNKGHYSYYYLGRKLYYIPLYFSVYFIIYITVLILKSIARHKVNFVHELDSVKGRSLDVGNKIDALEEQTSRSITEFRRRYIAM